jgi:hypothetical protein
MKASGRIPPHRKVLQEAASMQFEGSNQTTAASLEPTAAGAAADDYEQSKVHVSSKSSKKIAHRSDVDLDRQAVRDLDEWFERSQQQEQSRSR